MKKWRGTELSLHLILQEGVHAYLLNTDKIDYLLMIVLMVDDTVLHADRTGP